MICACGSAEAPSRRELFDFEGGVDGWRVDSGNVVARPSERQIGVHRHGDAFLDTAETRDGKRDAALHGALASPAFEIDHAYLVFRAGGVGPGKKCWVELRRDGGKKALRKAATTGRARMETHVLDVTDLRGETVRMRLVDRKSDEPCSIHLDWVRLVDG